MPVVIENIGTADDIATIRQLLDDWKVAFETKDVDRIMAFYAPGDEIVTYDLMPPLEYAGREIYGRAGAISSARSKGTLYLSTVMSR